MLDEKIFFPCRLDYSDAEGDTCNAVLEKRKGGLNEGGKFLSCVYLTVIPNGDWNGDHGISCKKKS